ncbi:HPr kinase/phosphatase C-terminal domain-containing protein [Pseudooceanicola sp.]|uniref:HPr kinase/phosphorylase n=1 Tax=Pseudooceanicola sp. TaxID=1914328 RepID=UPI00261C3393|nr:HPr kinase/phosphatase C-terminal domain-containing protein [Pseudooceanicola sp.]MDF1855226.1 HPr kinase/phosphatase C-terminal domain-containing protein [Pseudooceanicola sp.]
MVFSLTTDTAGDAAGRARMHATCVAYRGRGVLIAGASGSGKSALALQLMALGAALVSDDQVILERRDAMLIASAPDALRGKIEARFVGILSAPSPCAEVAIALAVLLDISETDRLPPDRATNILGCPVPLLHNVAKTYFPAAILQYLEYGRQA